MSDVAVARLFARLRWKMLRGVLATGGAPRVAVVIGMIAALVVGAVAGIAVAVLGRTADNPGAVFVTATSASVLAVMMIGVIAGVSQPVDPRVLATEPLADRQLGLGLLAASAAGPPGLSALLVGVGLFIGALRGFGSIVPAFLAAVAFLITLLLVSRTTINVLGLVATRYPRAGQFIVGVSSLVFYAAFQIVPRAIADLDQSGQDRLANSLAWTPMGQLGRALAEAGTDPVQSMLHVIIGALWLLPLVWIFTRTSRRLITTVKGGESRRTTVRADRRRPIHRLAQWMCGSGAQGAVAWRGVLTRFRTPRSALETFTGAGVGLAIVLVPVLTGREAGSGAVLVGGAVQLAVLFIAGNSFGSDGPALANELLAGVEPELLIRAKARAVVVSAAPIAVIGPLIAAGVTDEWNYLPAGFAVGVGGLLAGAGAAMVQSTYVPIAIPESDNPLASGDSGKGWFAGLMLAGVLLVLAVVTLPIALALLWAVERQSVTLVSICAVVTLAAGLAVQHVGIKLAARRWADGGAQIYADVIPAR